MQVIFVSSDEEQIIMVGDTPKEKKNLANLPPGTYEITVISKQSMIMDKTVTDGILIKQTKKHES